MPVGLKAYRFPRLLGSSPTPRQSAGALLSEHHINVVATLRLKSKRERFALKKRVENVHNWPLLHGKYCSQPMEKQEQLSHILQTAFPTASQHGQLYTFPTRRRLRNPALSFLYLKTKRGEDSFFIYSWLPDCVRKAGNHEPLSMVPGPHFFQRSCSWFFSFS